MMMMAICFCLSIYNNTTAAYVRQALVEAPAQTAPKSISFPTPEKPKHPYKQQEQQHTRQNADCVHSTNTDTNTLNAKIARICVYCVVLQRNTSWCYEVRRSGEMGMDATEMAESRSAHFRHIHTHTYHTCVEKLPRPSCVCESVCAQHGVLRHLPLSSPSSTDSYIRAAL